MRLKILVASVLICTSLFANDYKQFAQDMNYEVAYDVALEKAQKQKKDIMLVMVANFCPWCIKFEKLVLEKKQIDQKVQEKYIPLILNREVGNFPKRYDTPMVPTIFFIGHRSEAIKEKVVGYNNRQNFINIINQ